MTALPLFDPAAAYDRFDPARQRELGLLALALGCSLDGLDDGSMEVVRACERANTAVQDRLHALYCEALDVVDPEPTSEGPLVPDLEQVGICSCRRCGCTDRHGCPEGCWWAGPRLCSACAFPAPAS